MSGKTISEKILSAKSGCDARASNIVVCHVDHALGTDGSVPMAIDYFQEMGGKRVFDARRIAFSLDHYAPAPNAETARLHQRMRDFASAQGIHLWEVGEGIGHQLMIESGRANPGALVVGADSHAIAYGALNCFGTGIGSSDLAALLISGKVWLRVPESIKVRLKGTLRQSVYPKDIALALAKELGNGGAINQTLEFTGPAVETLEIEDRFVLSSLSVELGAKAAIFPADAQTRNYLKTHSTVSFSKVEPDPDAVYVREITINLDSLEPLLARPHEVDNVVNVQDAIGEPVQMVYLGTCIGGRTRDFHQALSVLKAIGKIAAGVQLVVTPASKAVYQALVKDGSLAEFIRFGAVIVTPGCGSCCGTCGAIPGDGVNVISSGTRNFKGRMGNSTAAIYLASPATCAAAAADGKIADPRNFYLGHA